MAVATLLALASASGRAAAADYPDHAIALVVPFPAGGPSDVGARALADALGRQLHQALVVENVGGAGGNIGATRAAHAAADGYTLLFTNFSLAISPALYDNLAYDAVKDLASIGVASLSATLFLARADFPAASMPELLATLKHDGEKILMATSGPGGPSDLCALLTMKSLGTRFTIVPYKGTGPAMTDLIAGHVDLMCDSIITALPQVKAGVVKTYGVTGKTRSAIAPEIPTLDEQGLKGVDYSVWSALYAPKGTPPAIIDRLAAALEAALKDPDFIKISTTLGQELPHGDITTPSGADAFLRSEIARWTSLLKGAARRQTDIYEDSP
jgi:tripartite-type tricarboxylate transporter receptor subunit TctC